MASSIDPTKPEAGTATTQSVRDNFSAAKTEIEALQSATVEGTAIKSTGETGGTKFLREDGDGTCSWQPSTGGGVDTSGVPVANDIARFTDADTIEGRSYAELKADLNLEIGIDVQAHSAVLDATTASFLTADEAKLDGIEAGADVTDTANVTSAGALMDSEVDADLKTLALPANTTISAFGRTLVGDADAEAARATIEAQTLIHITGAMAPTDGSVQYMGSLPITLTLPAYSKMYIPHDGTITKVFIMQLVTPTLGSTETSSIYVRVNNTTDTLITSAFQQDQLTEEFNNTGLSISVS
ncbi:MAG: hypothetical protein ACR2P6_07560, partial [Gammaproteobacteria bacterium]